MTQRCYIPKSVETGSALPEKRLKIYIQSLTHDKKDEQKQTATAGAPEWLGWPKKCSFQTTSSYV